MRTATAFVACLAVILIASLVGGRLASQIHLPKVTGYLLAGLVIGPSFAKMTGLPQIVTPFALDELKLISDVSLALILTIPL